MNTLVRFTVWLRPDQKKRLQKMAKIREKVGVKESSESAIHREALDRFIQAEEK